MKRIHAFQDNSFSCWAQETSAFSQHQEIHGFRPEAQILPRLYGSMAMGKSWSMRLLVSTKDPDTFPFARYDYRASLS